MLKVLTIQFWNCSEVRLQVVLLGQVFANQHGNDQKKENNCEGGQRIKVLIVNQEY